MPRKRTRSESAEPPMATRASRRLRSQEPEVQPARSPAPAAKQRRAKKVATRAKQATKKQQTKNKPLDSIEEETAPAKSVEQEVTAGQSDSADDARQQSTDAHSESQSSVPDNSQDLSQDLPSASQQTKDVVSISSTSSSSASETEAPPPKKQNAQKPKASKKAPAKKVSPPVIVDTGRVTRSRSKSQQPQESQQSQAKTSVEPSVSPIAEVETEQPVTSQPEVSQPEVSQPEVSQPEAPQSETSQSQSSEPKSPQEIVRVEQSASPRDESQPDLSESPNQQLQVKAAQSTQPKAKVQPKKPLARPAVISKVDPFAGRPLDRALSTKYLIPVATNERELQPLDPSPQKNRRHKSESEASNSADEIRPSVEDEEEIRQKRMAERKIIQARLRKSIDARIAREEAEEAAKAAKEKVEREDAALKPPPTPKKRGRPRKSVATARKAVALGPEAGEEGTTRTDDMGYNPDDSDDEGYAATGSRGGRDYMMSGALRNGTTPQKTPKKTPRQPRRRNVSTPSPESSPLSNFTHTPTLLGEYSPPNQLSPLATRSSFGNTTPFTPQQNNAQAAITQQLTATTGWRRLLTPISQIAKFFRGAPQTAPAQRISSQLPPIHQSAASAQNTPLGLAVPSRNHQIDNVDITMHDDERQYDDADMITGNAVDANMSDVGDNQMFRPRASLQSTRTPLNHVTKHETSKTVPAKRRHYFDDVPEYRPRKIGEVKRDNEEKERNQDSFAAKQFERARQRRIQRQRQDYIRRLYGARPGEKRRYHVVVDKMRFIPNPPGGGYGMYDKYFEQTDDSDDDVVSVNSSDGEISDIEYDACTPISRKRLMYAREGYNAFDLKSAEYDEFGPTHATTTDESKEVPVTTVDATGEKATHANSQSVNSVSKEHVDTNSSTIGESTKNNAIPTNVSGEHKETISESNKVSSEPSKITANTTNVVGEPPGTIAAPIGISDESTLVPTSDNVQVAQEAQAAPEAKAPLPKEKPWVPKTFEQEMHGKPTYTFSYSDSESDEEGYSEFSVLEEEEFQPPPVHIPLQARFLKVLPTEVVSYLDQHHRTLTNEEWALLEDYPSDDESRRPSKDDFDEKTWPHMKNPYEFLEYVFATKVQDKLDGIDNARYLNKLRNMRKKLEQHPFPTEVDEPEPPDVDNIFSKSTDGTPFAGSTPAGEVETLESPSLAVETPGEGGSSSDDQSALARARARADVHKPKTPSRLREVARVASSPLMPETPPKANTTLGNSIMQPPATAPPAVPAIEPQYIYTNYDWGKPKRIPEVDALDPEMKRRVDEEAANDPDFEKKSILDNIPFWNQYLPADKQLRASDYSIVAKTAQT